jgi:hypothetical protein
VLQRTWTREYSRERNNLGSCERLCSCFVHAPAAAAASFLPPPVAGARKPDLKKEVDKRLVKCDACN